MLVKRKQTSFMCFVQDDFGKKQIWRNNRRAPEREREVNINVDSAGSRLGPAATLVVVVWMFFFIVKPLVI